MTVVADPIFKAQRVKSLKAAARLYQTIEVELALSCQLSDEWTEEADEALRILEERFEKCDLQDPTVAAGAHDWAPEMSIGAQDGIDDLDWEAQQLAEITWAELFVATIPVSWSKVVGWMALGIMAWVVVILGLITIAGVLGLLIHLVDSL